MIDRPDTPHADVLLEGIWEDEVTPDDLASRALSAAQASSYAFRVASEGTTATAQLGEIDVAEFIESETGKWAQSFIGIVRVGESLVHVSHALGELARSLQQVNLEQSEIVYQVEAEIEAAERQSAQAGMDPTARVAELIASARARAAEVAEKMVTPETASTRKKPATGLVSGFMAFGRVPGASAEAGERNGRVARNGHARNGYAVRSTRPARNSHATADGLAANGREVVAEPAVTNGHDVREETLEPLTAAPDAAVQEDAAPEAITREDAAAAALDAFADSVDETPMDLGFMAFGRTPSSSVPHAPTVDEAVEDAVADDTPAEVVPDADDAQAEPEAIADVPAPAVTVDDEPAVTVDDEPVVTVDDEPAATVEPEPGLTQGFFGLGRAPSAPRTVGDPGVPAVPQPTSNGFAFGRTPAAFVPAPQSPASGPIPVVAPAGFLPIPAVEPTAATPEKAVSEGASVPLGVEVDRTDSEHPADAVTSGLLSFGRVPGTGPASVPTVPVGARPVEDDLRDEEPLDELLGADIDLAEEPSSDVDFADEFDGELDSELAEPAEIVVDEAETVDRTGTETVDTGTVDDAEAEFDELGAPDADAEVDVPEDATAESEPDGSEIEADPAVATDDDATDDGDATDDAIADESEAEADALEGAVTTGDEVAEDAEDQPVDVVETAPEVAESEAVEPEPELEPEPETGDATEPSAEESDVEESELAESEDVEPEVSATEAETEVEDVEAVGADATDAESVGTESEDEEPTDEEPAAAVSEESEEAESDDDESESGETEATESVAEAPEVVARETVDSDAAEPGESAAEEPEADAAEPEVESGATEPEVESGATEPEPEEAAAAQPEAPAPEAKPVRRAVKFSELVRAGREERVASSTERASLAQIRAMAKANAESRAATVESVPAPTTPAVPTTPESPAAPAAPTSEQASASDPAPSEPTPKPVRAERTMATGPVILGRKEPLVPPPASPEALQVRDAVASILGSLREGPHGLGSGLHWAAGLLDNGTETVMAVSTSDAGWLPLGVQIPAGVRVLWNVPGGHRWASIDDPVRQLVDYARRNGYTIKAVATTHESRAYDAAVEGGNVVVVRRPGRVLPGGRTRLEATVSPARLQHIRSLNREQAERQMRALVMDLETETIAPEHAIGIEAARLDARCFLDEGTRVPPAVLRQLHSDERALADVLGLDRTPASPADLEAEAPAATRLRDRLMERAIVVATLASAYRDLDSAVYAWTFARFLSSQDQDPAQ